MHAKEVVAGGHEPVHERRLLQVAEATVDLQRDPVTGFHHLARGLGVHRVGIVHQWRLKKTAEIDHGPDENDQNEKRPGPASGRLRGSLDMHEPCHYMRRAPNVIQCWSAGTLACALWNRIS